MGRKKKSAVTPPIPEGSLVEQVLENRDREEDQSLTRIEGKSALHTTKERDELGIRIFNSTDYIIIRILEINRQQGNGLLHTRNGQRELWLGQERLYKSAATVYRLSKYNGRLRDWHIESIWEKLLNILPYLDESKLVISDHLYWDIEAGKLAFSKENLLTIDRGF